MSILPAKRLAPPLTASFDPPRGAFTAPPASSFGTQAKIVLTVAAALPLVAVACYRARPAPGLRDDATESEVNTPRQPDVAARQASATVQPRMLLQAPLYAPVAAHTNARWLGESFQLVLGAGFFGMYQHLGALRAIAKLGLHGRIQELCGLSSGAIAGALYATLGPVGATESLLSLSLLDFLDLAPLQAWRRGTLCAGRAVTTKIAHETGRFGCTRLEDAPGPRLRLAAFDGLAGETVWHTQGPLAQTVARSAALPVLCANDGHFDGGWVDHHGYTALRPGKRALSLRINTGLEPDAMQRRVQRPPALLTFLTTPSTQPWPLPPRSASRA